MTVDVGQRYRHYKGTMYYVDDRAYCTTTGQPMVVYHAAVGAVNLFVRPLAEFIGLAPKGATQFLRFELVKEPGK